MVRRIWALALLLGGAEAFNTALRPVSAKLFLKTNPRPSYPLYAVSSNSEVDPRLQGILGIRQKLSQALLSEAPAGSSQEKFVHILDDFMGEYAESAYEAGCTVDDFGSVMTMLLQNVAGNMKDPYKFQVLHKAIREPTDYYQFGRSFVNPLIIWDQSNAYGIENLQEVADHIKNGDNVIFLANHQTEADPQVMTLMLDKFEQSALGEEMVFVAGHRVTTDPLAIPFSMGCNLLCIHSKKHIENPPEDKAEKQAQNMQAMARLQDLLSEGGKCIWVAPSGGRDRPSGDGDAREFAVSPFDSKSVEMFRLMASKAATQAKGRQDDRIPQTHFYSLAMLTRKLVPPPDQLQSALGEKRTAKRGNCAIMFGPEVTDEKAKLALPEGASRAQLRGAFSSLAESTVRDMYAELLEKEVTELSGSC